MSEGIRNCLERVFDNYLTEKEKPFADNALGAFVRGVIPEAIKEVLSRDDLIIKGSVGGGNWADVPWIGVLNPENTESASYGIYIVYLFSADLESVYLCQAQGVTKVKEEFGKDKTKELLRRSDLIRSRVPEHRKGFTAGPIDLNGSTNLAKDYNPSVAYFKEYKKNSLPREEQLRSDLKEIVCYYDYLISRGGTDNVDTALELSSDEEVDGTLTEIIERRRYVRHTRIERNSKASRSAKKILGTVCQGCGFDFERFYGERGRNFIEVHHLIPLHTLPEGTVVSMDPQKDFAVLCSNCHRMVHKSREVLAIGELSELTEKSSLRDLLKKK